MNELTPIDDFLKAHAAEIGKELSARTGNYVGASSIEVSGIIDKPDEFPTFTVTIHYLLGNVRVAHGK